MWHDLKRSMSGFPTAVLTAHDTEGYPTSVRTSVEADDHKQEVRVVVHADMELQAGPASLLFHNHDQQLWNQRVLLVRGVLVSTPAGWSFSPRRLVPSMGEGGPLAMLRAIINCRKTARAYLHKRGLARPRVLWDKLQTITAQK